MTSSILTAVATAGLLALAAPAAASTVHEHDLPGGSFSGVFSAPTDLGAGVTGVTGSGAQGAHDFFVFHLPSGAQTLTFRFAAPAGIGYSYSAGGSIRVGTSPFPWAWAGDDAGSFHLGHGQPGFSRTLTLGQAFEGTLHVGLYFTYGSGIGYSVSTDAAVPGVVPSPAAGLMLLSALGLAGFVARRRRA